MIQDIYTEIYMYLQEIYKKTLVLTSAVFLLNIQFWSFKFFTFLLK